MAEGTSYNKIKIKNYSVQHKAEGT